MWWFGGTWCFGFVGVVWGLTNFNCLNIVCCFIVLFVGLVVLIVDLVAC